MSCFRWAWLFSSALLTVLVAPCAALAEVVVGRYAGEFLALGAGARALAMGGAAVAAPTPASATYYNPSALSGLQKRHAEFMHASQFDNVFTYDYLSFAGPLSPGYAGGITALYTRVGDIPITRLADPGMGISDNNRVLVDRKTGDHELALMGAVGRQVDAGWRIGAAAKVLYKTVAGESAGGLGFDVGAGRSLPHRLEVGLAIHDLTTSMLVWSTGRMEAILPSMVVGGAWSFAIPSVNANVGLAADLDCHFESRGAAETVTAGLITAEPRLGLEYLIARTVALRGGLNGDDVAAGAGIRFAWMDVSAAFQDHQDLGLTHRVSVAVKW